jgi:hypothetical protein
LRWEDEASHSTARAYISEGFAKIGLVAAMKDAIKSGKIDADIKCQRI